MKPESLYGTGLRARRFCLISLVFFASKIALAVSSSFDEALPLSKQWSKFQGRQDPEEPGSKLMRESERSLYSPEQQGDLYKIFKAAMEKQGAINQNQRGRPVGPSKRIINGDLAPKDAYPWFVSLFNENFDLVCGGFLVSPQFVATAAHCLVFSEEDPVRYAAVGLFCLPQEDEFDNCGQKWELFDFGLQDQFPDMRFDENTIEYDFALIKLNGTSTIEPVKIDDGSYSESYKNATDKLWTLGFGVDGFVDGELSTPENLQHIELSYVTNEQCDSAFQDSYYFLPDIAPSMMCAKGPDALQYGGSCYGDSGGPLYDSVNDVVVGVVSWGYPSCDDPAYPSVFGRISSTFAELKLFICSIDQNATICNHSQSPSVSPMPTTLSASPSKEPPSACTDYPNWTDSYEDGCDWYEANDDPGCPLYGENFPGSQGVANEACCYCGGGIKGTTIPTKAPVRSPTIVPYPTLVPRTRAPAFAVCSDSEATFEVDIKFDGHSHDISWVLSRVCTGSLVEMKRYESRETSDFYSKCMPKGRYKFELFDSHGDGFSDPSGRAIVSYSVAGAGEIEFRAEGNFGSSVEFVFGKSDSTDTE